METPITNTTAIFMIALTVIFDLVQFLFSFLHLIPAVGNITAFVVTTTVTIVYALTFYLWFKIKGVSFNTSKRMVSFGGGILLEFIPVLSALPACTLSVVLVIASTRLKEIAGAVPGAEIAGKITGANDKSNKMAA